MSTNDGEGSKTRPTLPAIVEERTEQAASPAVGETLQSAQPYRPGEVAAVVPPYATPAREGLRLPPPCFVTMRGEVLEYAPPQRIRVRFPVEEAWLNPYGVLQGGFLVAMFDNVVGMCAYAHEPKRQSATLELSSRFFRSIRSGHLIVDGLVLRAGRTTITVECVAWDDAREMCAKVTATNMFL
jgi:uncharacterized protein (TIGR00369 family)